MRLRLPVWLIFSAVVAAIAADAKSSPGALTLWYDKPAADWEHFGLPIGNGAMGAVITGGVASDDIQFNEKTLWTGGPGAAGFDAGLPPQALTAKLADLQARLNKDLQAKPEDIAAILGHPVTAYGDYQPFGNLVLTFAGLPATPKAYRRILDLGAGLAHTSFEANGVRYTREYFASYPAHAIVIRLAASKRGKISFIGGAHGAQQPQRDAHRAQPAASPKPVPSATTAYATKRRCKSSSKAASASMVRRRFGDGDGCRQCGADPVGGHQLCHALSRLSRPRSA
jgi:hypothetical protein